MQEIIRGFFVFCIAVALVLVMVFIVQFASDRREAAEDAHLQAQVTRVLRPGETVSQADDALHGFGSSLSGSWKDSKSEIRVYEIITPGDTDMTWTLYFNHQHRLLRFATARETLEIDKGAGDAIFSMIAYALVSLFSAIAGSAAFAWAVALRRFPETRRAGTIIFRAGAVGAACALVLIVVQIHKTPCLEDLGLAPVSQLYIGTGWASFLTARLMLARNWPYGQIDQINRTEFPPDTRQFPLFCVLSLILYVAGCFLTGWLVQWIGIWNDVSGIGIDPGCA